MADNKLAGLTEAGNRDADTLKGGQGVDTLSAADCHDAVERAHEEDAKAQGGDSLQGGQGDDAIHGDQANDRVLDNGAQPKMNTTLGTATESGDPDFRDSEGRSEKDQAADTIATRGPDSEAKPMSDPVRPPIAPGTEDAIRNSAMGALNATPGSDPYSAPNHESQRTGAVADTVYRSPSMTRGSAINQIEVMWGELQMKLHDFDHDISGMPEDLQALVGFVKSRQAKA